MPLIDETTIRKIIVDGDNSALNEAAEQIGKELAREYRLTTSQIRGIFGTVRQIEMDWLRPDRSEQAADAAERERRALRELTLLKPRMAYQAARDRGRGVEELRQVLAPAIDLIANDRQRFKNFVDFFEAILAYHRAAGGRDN
ncbi:type III-A CRISPR-associated protein Csm2 [Kallotenue papyrolyticum]|uniref:type III-A CRISPR-associated protein Csm2 n=1 Tax=Kallotenue papyrolyticum TaxID=1325125 RepID=UPI0004926089|nr:type III-A CRISPR-associated protein Csm2 [Kallotenue papyrolyticum]